MLDLIFLVLGIYVIFKASHGEFKEIACNVATVVGVIAAILGYVSTVLSRSTLAPLNLVVLIMAVLLRYAAKRLVRLYDEKRSRELEELDRQIKRYTREEPNAQNPVYTEETFDNPDIRFNGDFKNY